MIGESKGQKKQKRGKTEFAERLLVQLFRRHLLLEANKVYTIGRSLGISERTLRQAKANLQLNTVKIAGRYYWQPTFSSLQLFSQKGAGKSSCHQKDINIIVDKKLMDQIMLELILSLPVPFKVLWIFRRLGLL